MTRMHQLRLLAVCAAAAVSPAGQAAKAETAELQALQRQLAQVQAALHTLTEENRTLREHQEELDRRLGQLSSSAPPAAAGTPALPGAGDTTAVPAGGDLRDAFGSGLRLWGYGEVYYTHPTSEPEESQMDLARAVIGIGYRFDERTELNSEYEVEHAVSSASDVGEFEVEQFYVDRRLSEAVTMRAGLFLMPFGFINEHHEPTNFYGVQRNFVETLIIPSTWREGGFNLHGDTSAGFGWNVGLTTGFDFSKWSFAPDYPPYRTALELEDSDIAPLQAVHQELALANAHRLSQYLALGYYGVPGLTLGAAVSTGKAVPPPAASGAQTSGDPRVTLWEAHARWAPARWDLAAIYSRGTISDTAAANAANPGSPNPVPSAFYGYYLQAAYALWQHADYRLDPFVRFERYDMGASYAGTAGPSIYGLWPQNHDRVFTLGANFHLGPHVVLKGDYQWFQVNSGFNRFDLGLGVSF